MNKSKYVLVTGVTSGIGLATAKELQKKGYNVFGTSRTREKEDEAKKHLGDDFYFIRGDLSSRMSLDTIAIKAKEYIKENGLFAIVNNAGTFFSKLTLSEDNIEMQFAVNTIAPMYLSLLLYESLNKANGRIINVTSSSHYNTIIKWKDIQLKKSYGQLRAYKQTKALSVLLSREFNKYSKSVKMYMADPGLVSTEIGFKNTSAIGRLVWSYRKSIGQTLEEGASTSVYLVDSEYLPNKIYYKNSKHQPSSKVTQNVASCKRVWDYFSELYCIDPLNYMK